MRRLVHGHGIAGGDLSGSYPNPSVAAVHATSGTIDGVPIGATTPSTGAFSAVKVGGSQSISGVQGTTGGKFAAANGSFTAGNLTGTDAFGNLVDASTLANNNSGFGGNIIGSNTVGGFGPTIQNTANTSGSYSKFEAGITATQSFVGFYVLPSNYQVWPTR